MPVAGRPGRLRGREGWGRRRGERRWRGGPVAQHAPRVLRGQHREVGVQTHLVAQQRRVRAVERRVHPAAEQCDQPRHEDQRDGEAVLDDLGEDGRRDDQDDAEQHGPAVEPSRRGEDRPGRVVLVVERERGVPVGEEVHVRVDPCRPAHHAADEAVHPFGKAAHEQRAEPSDDEDEERGDEEEIQHDELRDGQDDAERHGQTALRRGAGEPHVDPPGRCRHRCVGHVAPLCGRPSPATRPGRTLEHAHPNGHEPPGPRLTGPRTCRAAPSRAAPGPGRPRRSRSTWGGPGSSPPPGRATGVRHVAGRPSDRGAPRGLRTPALPPHAVAPVRASRTGRRSARGCACSANGGSRRS